MKSTGSRAALFAASALLASAAVPLQAQGILIDDFSTDIAETDADGQYTPANALGGHARYASSNTAITYSVSGGVLRARNDTGVAGLLTVSYEGASAPSTQYALPDVDLTSGGQNTHLKVNVLSVTTSEPQIYVRARVRTDGSNHSYHDQQATGPGILEYPLGSFSSNVGSGADFEAAKLVGLSLFLEPGDEIEIAWYTAGDYEFPAPPSTATPDTEGPSLSFLKKKRLKTPRARHKFKGTASDNDAVAKVEVKSRLRRGWRKAKLRASGRWIYRTPWLGSGRNKFKVRAEDASGNRSRVKRVKAMGL